MEYAVCGGVALNAHDFRRFTEVVDILVTRESLKVIHDRLDGLGYVPPFRGSKNLRDVEQGVRIEFLLSGDYPGDGKPKPWLSHGRKTLPLSVPGSASSRFPRSSSQDE